MKPIIIQFNFDLGEIILLERLIYQTKNVQLTLLLMTAFEGNVFILFPRAKKTKQTPPGFDLDMPVSNFLLYCNIHFVYSE